MGDMYLICPHCNMELACDEQDAGQTIQCPSCQGWLTAPSAPAAPLPPQQYGGSRSQRPGAKKKKRKQRGSPSAGSGGAAKAIKIAVIVLVLGVAFYFSWGLFSSWQESFNEQSREASKNADGGQLGHIADLYSVLETTDPSNFVGGYMPQGEMSGYDGQQRDPVQEVAQQQLAFTTRMQGLPIVQPTWSLNLESVTVPEGRACGRIAGTDFVADLARISPAGDSHVFSIRQGAEVHPEQEILVYFRLSPGQAIGGQTWAISPDMKGRNVPQVVKRWKTNPNSAPKQKVYYSGYAMKLDLASSEQGAVSGTIYVALPDEEQTVVGGKFYAQTVLPQPSGVGQMDY